MTDPHPPESPIHLVHDEHFYEVSNPRFLGLPTGVWIAMVAAVIGTSLVAFRFLHGYVETLKF